MAEAAATPPEAPAAAAQPGVWIDPYRAYNFKLVIQGVTMGHFTECTGLGVRVQALRYQEGGGHVVQQAGHFPLRLDPSGRTRYDAGRAMATND